MKIAVFDTHNFEKSYLETANIPFQHQLSFFEVRLNIETVKLTEGMDAVCVFVNDHLDSETLHLLKANGVRLIALRCAGFNNVNVSKANELGFSVVRVPEYSPYAVAEHAVALILTLNRKIHRAYNRVREGNFSLNNLVGFDLHNKTVGVVGTGKIGAVFAHIMKGFGCQILAYDTRQNPALNSIGVKYVTFEELMSASDIVSLHVPLVPETFHLLNAETLSLAKKNLILINTGRGGLIDAKALLEALKNEKVGAAGLDVYEEEEGIFFEDNSGKILQDDTLARLISFPNVIVTSHQAFLTHEALQNIAATTFTSIDEFTQGRSLTHRLV